jgi:hypothetical protein
VPTFVCAFCSPDSSSDGEAVPPPLERRFGSICAATLFLAVKYYFLCTFACFCPALYSPAAAPTPATAPTLQPLAVTAVHAATAARIGDEVPMDDATDSDDDGTANPTSSVWTINRRDLEISDITAPVFCLEKVY